MINFFISSTFKDFREERSILNNEILPTFREQARAHGESVNMVDFSWGINNFNLSEEESAKIVLSVCLNAVDKCRPFLIAFIGERYGSEIKNKNWMPAEFDKKIPDAVGKSITELEIIHALNGKCDAIICIRKIKNNFPDAKIKKKYVDENFALKKLKNWLEEKYKEKILEYEASWTGNELGDFRTLDGKNFFDALQEKMLECCQSYWQEKKIRQEREKNFTEQIISERSEFFFGRTILLHLIKNQLAKNKNVHIFGESGCGKTSLMCKIASDLRKENKNVITLLAGSSLYNNSQFFLEQMVYLLEEILSEPHANFFPSAEEFEKDFYNKWKQHLEYLCGKTREPIYFIVDGIDQLEKTDPHRNKIDFLPTTTENIHCLISYTSDFKKNLQINAQNFQSREIPLLDLKNIESVLEKILKRHEKDLFSETAAAIKEKKSSKNFLFLQMCARYLLMISARELTDLESEDIIKLTVERIKEIKDSVEDAAWFIIEKAAEKLCKNPQAVLDAIKLISASRTGLRIFDLQEILGFDNLLTLDFWRLRKYLHEEFFIDRPNGCIDFSHQIIRKSVFNKIKSENLLETCENLIANYLEKLPEKDPLKCSEGFFFAQKKLMFDFGAKLLHEATNNFAMLYEIRNALLSDGGKFGNKLVKNYMDDNAICLKFFGNLNLIMTESAKDYEILLNLLSSVQINKNSRGIHYCEIEFLKALQKSHLNKKSAKKHLMNVINFGENESKKNSPAYYDLHFCNLIELAYFLMMMIESDADKKILLKFSEKNLEWLSREIELINDADFVENSFVKFTFAQQKFISEQKFEPNSFREYFDKILMPAYDYLKNLHKKKPSEILYLIMLVQFCIQVFDQVFKLNYFFEVNHVLNDGTSTAIFFGKESEKYSGLLMSLDPGNLDFLFQTGATKINLALAELKSITSDLEEIKMRKIISEAYQHAKKGLFLIREYHKKNPTQESFDALNDAENLVLKIAMAKKNLFG